VQPHSGVALLAPVDGQILEAHPAGEGFAHPLRLSAPPRPGFGGVAGVSVGGAPLLGKLPVRLREFAPPLDLFPELRLQIGKVFVAVALFFFAFTTLLAYYYIAETNVAYIRRTVRFPGELTILKFILLASVFYGTVRTADLAWGLGDIGVGLMAWLNIVGILILFFMGKPAIKALRDYEEQRNAGVTEYTFDPDKLGIKNADFWKN